MITVVTVAKHVCKSALMNAMLIMNSCRILLNGEKKVSICKSLIMLNYKCM